ncbi:ferredoxin family protein [Rhizobium leguminosarum]|uniref:Ferredoxin-like protein n=2 Tax=Rhizobium leguminosarum TaxID=384 RepID=A1Z1W5_RHILT|nr:ferredoxin family protein [Rhizobium leguminosarum]ABM47386.1 ferredoxin-like protein [Rhizobium leguminosarum bv. trifolii]RWX23915.1 ferredoxin family protein [Rhizobium leguminosarum]UIK01390.1 ferredoxin family protein [Rhizobium leguminosarum]UIK14293.1 ferredoxin family protein [Rhizobium leguminosarum]UIL30417.1 ferredoxin family protein [Rhizobium leguminosarum]
MKAIVKQRVEDKLYRNRYVVDSGRPHIKVLKHLFPSPNLLALTQVCPAKCYQLNDRGQVTIVSDGCLECGTCRVLCGATGEITWKYPRGGFGVLFKFG